jgi:putative SOS response-associated peptidase YedK
MSRRSIPQSKTDDLAFPIRVKLGVPDSGFGRLSDDINCWLAAVVGHGNYALHSVQALFTSASALYFRDIEAARAFLAAFPALELADSLQSRGYSAPGLVANVSEEVLGVCNIYSLTKGQAAIREIAGVWEDRTGNLPSLPGIYPDTAAPVVSNTAQGRVLSMMRWGMPSPAFALKGRKTDPGVTNVRNTASPHWRRWLSPGSRCVVPFSSFSEYQVRPGQAALPIWFALDETRPLAFFAGIWTPWTSVRKLKEGETRNELFGFLTTEANAVVGAIHPKAMPVILTSPEEIETWLTAPWDIAAMLQRPLPDHMLSIVSRGGAKDG